CLEEMCAQYQPTPGPTPEPTPGECPEPQDMVWEFGKMRGGFYTLSTKSMPSDITSTLRGLDIVVANQVSSELPEGVTFSLDLTRYTGMLRGTLPTVPRDYHILYYFIDSRKCIVATLHVVVSVAGGEVPTTPTAELDVIITNVAVEAVCESNYSHWVTIFWEITGGTPPLFIDGVWLTLPDATTRMISGIPSTSGQTRTQVNYPDGGSLAVRIQVRDAVGTTAWDTYTSYLPPCYGMTTPELETVCVDVSAVVIVPRYSTTTTYQTSEEMEAHIQMLVDGEEYETPTPFSICRSPGSQVMLQAPRSFFTPQRQQFAFSHWEKYEDEEWILVSELPLLQITLQYGGMARAVYRPVGLQ
ncbi:MAG: hypothetical protein KAU10_07355, partial [Dehalococcoidia bacterium]|nr:hypothetical protein [Dehalococcoidia bacterium]